MTRLKQLVALTVLSSSLIAPAIALAEPMPPAGTTVNSIALTTVETNVSSITGNSMPPMGNSPSAMPNNINNDIAAPMMSTPSDSMQEDDADMTP